MVPPVNIPIPTKLDPKLGGEFTNPPKMGSQNSFDNHSQMASEAARSGSGCRPPQAPASNRRMWRTSAVSRVRRACCRGYHATVKAVFGPSSKEGALAYERPKRYLVQSSSQYIWELPTIPSPQRETDETMCSYGFSVVANYKPWGEGLARVCTHVGHLASILLTGPNSRINLVHIYRLLLSTTKRGTIFSASC